MIIKTSDLNVSLNDKRSTLTATTTITDVQQDDSKVKSITLSRGRVEEKKQNKFHFFIFILVKILDLTQPIIQTIPFKDSTALTTSSPSTISFYGKFA